MNNRRLVDDYNNQKVFNVFHQVFLTGIPAYAFDWECIRKDGTCRFVEVSVRLKTDENHRPVGFMGIARDVTQRKLAEQALRESEERYRMIIENIQDGYYEVDLDGRYTFFNEGFLRITGYAREALRGMHHQAIVGDRNKNEVVGLFKQVCLTGIPAHAFDWECIRSDGSRRFVEVSVSLRKSISGAPLGFMGIARDITERKRYLAELEAKENELKVKNQSLEEANAALNILMKKVEENRSVQEETIRNRLRTTVLPFLQRAREKTRDKAVREQLDLVDQSLNDMVAPFVRDLAAELPRLTSTEIDVANLVMQGKRTKEIAEFMRVSPKAVEAHRNNLRRKFGLTNQKTCLRARLLSVR
jgi:PAS domain S-box-containing protein